MPRNLWLAVLSLASFSSIARATETPPPLGAGQLTVLGGAATGGGLGLQAQMYFKGDRFSAFAGVSRPSDFDDERTVFASSAGFVGGLRVYTGGRVHRGFLEASVAPVGLEWDPSGQDYRPMYGPALQAGWQMTRPGGFTLVLSAGLGHALDTDFADGSTNVVASFGLGYTWRHR